MKVSSTIRSSGSAPDMENRLASVTLPAGGGAVSFRYDPFGRRIEKTTASGSALFLEGRASEVP